MWDHEARAHRYVFSGDDRDVYDEFENGPAEDWCLDEDLDRDFDHALRAATERDRRSRNSWICSLMMTSAIVALCSFTDLPWLFAVLSTGLTLASTRHRMRYVNMRAKGDG